MTRASGPIERATVLVTGASSGIGRAAAVALAGRGYVVFGASRGALAQAPQGGVTWLAMDVRDEASVRAGVKTVLATGLPLAGVVCAAGYGLFGSVEETSIERARSQFETNVMGVLTVLRAVLPVLRGQGRGRIVVIGSLAGRAPIPFQAHYSASKAALDALVLALRNELHGTGVHATLVEPGDIRTDFNDRMDWGSGGPSPYGERAERCAEMIRQSLPKAPDPGIVAEVVMRAFAAARPRVRYTVGPDSAAVPLGRRLLPDGLCLALIRNHFKV
jgi:NAD(P)-dependent dehydrogenase (short-subunit alcohol dehydrogenase family)